MGRPATPPVLVSDASAQEIAGALWARLAQEGFAQDDEFLEAFVRIVARQGELVAGCVNAAAEGHLDAFSRWLPVAARPAAAAGGFVTVRPAPGGNRSPGPRLSRHSRLATQDGATVFETLADLEIVRAEATDAVFVSAGHRARADVAGLFAPAGRSLVGDVRVQPLAHTLYLGQSAILQAPGLARIRIQLDLASPAAPASYAWAAQDRTGSLPLVVVEDGTNGLTCSGEVVLEPLGVAWPTAAVDGLEAAWLTLREVSAAPGRRPPHLAGVRIVGEASIEAEPLAAACADGLRLDVSSDVFPFSERPRFGSTWQLLSPLFGETGATIEIQIELINPAGAEDSPIPPVTRDDAPRIAWEISTASGFRPLAVTDGTQQLTQSGVVAFTVPSDVAWSTLAGEPGPWLRARLVGGGFGRTALAEAPMILGPRAPAVRSVVVGATLVRGPLAPDALVSEGALERRRIDPEPSRPEPVFPEADVDGAALYLGMEGLAGASAFDALAHAETLCWAVAPAPPTGPIVLAEARGRATPRAQLRVADGWRDLPVRDRTSAFTRPGLFEVTLAEPPAAWVGSLLDGARPKAWLRLVWPNAVSPADLPHRLSLNAVPIRQTEQLHGEVLGSSNGRAGQRFSSLRTPIQGDVELEVREGGLWVVWPERDRLDDVPPDARAYTIDRTTGEVCFGDGRHGRIPPQGVGNMRLATYATGGGASGNQPAGAVSMLRSAPPGLEGVTNPEPTVGGQDAESSGRASRRASAWLMHRDRAVCADDYAALALRASAEVARAYCVVGGGQSPAGVVTLVIVPNASGPAPQPRLDLLETVKAYLDERRPPSGRLVLAGPTYAPADIDAVVFPRRGWSGAEIAAAAAQALTAFLHPLSGGDDGHGWAAGARPNASDLYALLARVEGLDRAERLVLRVADASDAAAIVAAGAMRIRAGS